jgi:hypothetical protein
MVLRYQCRGAHMKPGDPRCITFSGLRVDRAVAGEVLRAIEGNAIEAAVEAAEKMRQHFGEQRRAVELELEQARYEAKLAARRYEAVDPDRRLVAAELEARWNTALQKAQDLEERLAASAGGGVRNQRRAVGAPHVAGGGPRAGRVPPGPSHARDRVLSSARGGPAGTGRDGALALVEVAARTADRLRTLPGGRTHLVDAHGRRLIRMPNRDTACY